MGRRPGRRRWRRWANPAPPEEPGGQDGSTFRPVPLPRSAPLPFAAPLAALLGALLTACLVLPGAAWASPGLCVGPVCGDGFSRSAKHAFQLRMRLVDQRGHHERITVDCRDGRISPAVGPVARGYGAAVARRVCRLVGETPA